MQKKYIVRLTAAECEELLEVVKRLKGSSQQVRRAQMLLKADADGPAWSDQRIADAFGCRRQTVEKVRERFVMEGFEVTLRGKRPAEPPRKPVLNGSSRPRSSPCVWDRLRRASRTGHCGSWRTKPWSCKSSRRSVTRPSAKR
jgi:biotin operon repressor